MNQKSEPKPKSILSGEALIGCLKDGNPIYFKRESDRDVGSIIDTCDQLRNQLKNTMTADEIRNAIDDGRD